MESKRFCKEAHDNNSTIPLRWNTANQALRPEEAELSDEHSTAASRPAVVMVDAAACVEARSGLRPQLDRQLPNSHESVQASAGHRGLRRSAWVVCPRN